MIFEIRAGLRSLAASPQTVFYRLRDDRSEIVRVLDGRQDIEDILTEEYVNQQTIQELSTIDNVKFLINTE